MCVILSRKGLDARKKPTYLSAYIALILLHSRVMHRLPQTSGPFFITSDNSDAYSPKVPRWFGCSRAPLGHVFLVLQQA